MRVIEGYSAIKEVLAGRISQRGLESVDKESTVRRIIADVRAKGDAALRDYTERFDGVRLEALEVSREEISRARQLVDKELLAALELAAARITDFHTVQKNSLVRDRTGKSLGWVMRPLRSVGVHVPGFTAPMPSSLLMTATPARVAGVEEIYLVTPPGKQGRVSPITLAAADIAGVDRVFSIGGAQAIAALAYGTESVPAVDKICGPGNISVFLA